MHWIPSPAVARPSRRLFHPLDEKGGERLVRKIPSLRSPGGQLAADMFLLLYSCETYCHAHLRDDSCSEILGVGSFSGPVSY